MLRLRTNHEERKVTEIDDSKFGKCKYNLGKHVRVQELVRVIGKESDRVFLLAVHQELRRSL